MESSFLKVAKPVQEERIRRWGRGWRNKGGRPEGELWALHLSREAQREILGEEGPLKDQESSSGFLQATEGDEGEPGGQKLLLRTQGPKADPA